jgi:hypothetical protein
MAKRTPTRVGREDNGPARLLIPRSEVAAKLDSRISFGRTMVDGVKAIGTYDQLNEARSKYYSWSEFNIELLRRSFSNEEEADTYRGMVIGVGGDDSPVELKDDLQGKLRRLESLKDRLELFEEPLAAPVTAPTPSPAAAAPSAGSGTVFVVHGHDDGKRELVARTVRKLTDVEPVILHEQPNRGQTVIEKLEASTSDTGFAIIILTGDDEGGVKGSGDLQPRGRQNLKFQGARPDERGWCPHLTGVSGSHTFPRAGLQVALSGE